MGVPTMVSSPNRVQDRSHYSPISREGSVFNVNSDGVHAHLGNMTKTNASNMNLDDLVKDVMCGSNDELHILTNHHHPNPPSCSSSSNFALINGSLRKRAAAGGFEGWKDASNGFTNPNSVSLDHETMPRGDDDDHLLDSSQLHVGIDHHQSVFVSQDWPEQLDMGVFESNFQVSSEPFFENSSIGGGVVVNGGSENDFGIPMSMPMPMQMLTASDELQTVVVEKKKKKKHRYASEVMEKTDEKRQRRMIKNRESAARSRARKQAYTNQLELQVSKLREANKRLKIQQEMDMQSSSRRTILPRYQLRRSSSATF